MDDAALARRFGAIEAQLALISEHLGLECPPFPAATVRLPVRCVAVTVALRVAPAALVLAAVRLA